MESLKIWDTSEMIRTVIWDDYTKGYVLVDRMGEIVEVGR